MAQEVQDEQTLACRQGKKNRNDRQKPKQRLPDAANDRRHPNHCLATHHQGYIRRNDLDKFLQLPTKFALDATAHAAHQTTQALKTHLYLSFFS